MDSILLNDNIHWVEDYSKIYNNFVKRDILHKAISYLDTQMIIAIIGARRVGKSTLAKLMIKNLLKTTNPKNIFFINLEKPDFIPYKNDPTYLDTIYEQYLKLANPNLEESIYFFIDEIQIFKNWEVFIKSRYENSNIKFIITGSNSSLLQSSYSTLLTGRVIKLNLKSFNFREILRYKKISYNTRLERVKNRIAIKRELDEYLKWGGYYLVISTKNEEIKKDILKNIAEDIILKDIVPQFSIKNSSAIRDLFYYVVSNTTTTLNYSKLAKKIGIDAKMIKEYIGYFEDNFLLSLTSKYHNKLTSQLNSSKKIYLNDNGFLNLGINRSQNLGIKLENMVSQYIDNSTYLLENRECDFFANDTLYQVSYSIEDEMTKKREIDGVKYFANKYNIEQMKIITYDRNETIEGIDIVSFDEFVLGEVV